MKQMKDRDRDRGHRCERPAPCKPPYTIERLGMLLEVLIEQGKVLMATSAETLAKVREGHSVGDSVVALLVEVKRKLDEALADQTLPPAVQADIDAVFTEVSDQIGKYEAAIVANTPSEPTP